MLEYRVRTINKITNKNWKIYKIVIADKESNQIVYTTDYDSLYVNYDKSEFEDKDYRAQAYELCRFLNWLDVEAPSKYRKRFQEKGIKTIDFDCAQYYLDEHAKGNLSGMRGKPQPATQISLLGIISNIVYNVYSKYDKEALKEHSIRTLVYEGKRKHYIYEMRVILNRNVKKSRLIRYTPEEVLNMLVDAARNEDSMIVLALDFLRYGGLRKGEVCNIRAKDSPLGPGYAFVEGSAEDEYTIEEEITENGRDGLTTIQFDLLDEYNLRSDKISTGKIKVPRKQSIPFCIMRDHPEIWEDLESHLKERQKYDVEDEKPLFINRKRNKKTGKYMAMTASDLTARIKTLMKKFVIPKIEEGDNEPLKAWARKYHESTWGPHTTRFSYSISLVVDYAFTVEQLQKARGDRSVESSAWYINNSPRLGELLRKEQGEILEEMLNDAKLPEDF